MDCGGVRELISARIGGHSSPEDGRRIAEHLGRCEACRRAELSMRAFDLGVVGGETRVPSGFRSDIFDRLEKENLIPPRRAAVFTLPFARWAVVPLAAAAGLALFLLVGKETGSLSGRIPDREPRLARQDLRPSSGGAQENGVSGSAQPAAALSPEEAEIVAHLDLLENGASSDGTPDVFDEMFLPPGAGRSG